MSARSVMRFSTNTPKFTGRTRSINSMLGRSSWERMRPFGVASSATSETSLRSKKKKFHQEMMWFICSKVPTIIKSHKMTRP